MKKQYLTLLVLLCGCSFLASAQHMPIGQWNDYYCYREVLDIASSSDRVYAATSNGLFYYDKNYQAIRKFNTRHGLSDTDLRSIAFDPYTQTLVVGYRNGNLDLVHKNSVFNLSDIKRKNISGSKTIQRIIPDGKGKAFLCCDFGIVVLNLVKKEISETFFLGNNNTPLQVLDLALADSSLYAATEKGLLKANRFSPKLTDFSEWKTVQEISSSQKFGFACALGEHVFAGRKTGDGKDSIWKLTNQQWTLFDTTPTSKLSVSKQRLIHSRKIDNSHFFGTKIYDPEMNLLIDYGQRPGDWNHKGVFALEIDNEGKIWFADSAAGLIESSPNMKVITWHAPQGTSTNRLYSIYHSPSKLYVTGGMQALWTALWVDFLVESFDGDSWKSFHKESIPTLSGIFDPIKVIEHPKNNQSFFVGTWTKGVVEINGENQTTLYDDENSSLQAIYINGEKFSVRAGGLGFDKKDQLWVTNSYVARNLSRKKTNGEWQSFDLSHISSSNVKDVLVDYFNQLWIQSENGDILLVRENNTGGIDALVANLNNGNDQTTNAVNCIVEDKKGFIWVGTNRGIKINVTSRKLFDNPSGNQSSTKFQTINFDGRPLLENDNVTCIAVDGADRKWIGTQNSGLFLMSAEGTQKIHQFNTDNSPLPSNQIISLAIHPRSGEVFVCTEKGLLSYQSDASDALSNEQSIRIFPNPVRANYEGNIAIQGLVNNAHVKITDASGLFVFSTQAKGGTATWNGKLPNGQRAKIGVYIVFATDEEGKTTDVQKIIFTR